MFFDDNASLQTANTVTRNQRGFMPRADDSEDGLYERLEPLFDQDYYELHFASRRERSRLRRNVRDVTPPFRQH